MVLVERGGSLLTAPVFSVTNYTATHPVLESLVRAALSSSDRVPRWLSAPQKKDIGYSQVHGQMP